MRVAALLVFSLLMCVASPVLATASIMDVGEDSPLKVLDGSGVVIAVADTGTGSDPRASFNFGNGYFGTTAITSAGSNGNGSLFEYDVPNGYYALNTKNINTYG